MSTIDKTLVSKHRPKFYIAMSGVLSALLTFSITFGVMHYMDSRSGPKEKLTAMGSVFMSPTELVRQIKTLKQKLFWMGPLEDSTFTAVFKEDGTGIVMYWPSGTNANNFNVPRRVIRTYPNLTVYSSDYHPLNLPSDIRTVSYSNLKMQYGVKNMDFQTFFLNDSPMIVEVHYASPHTESQLADDVGNLRLVG